MKALKNDLSKDTLDINRIVKLQNEDIVSIENIINRIYSPPCTIDSIKQIAMNEFEYAFKAKRDYNNNTYKTIISSGTIELLDDALIENLMELNTIQSDQLQRFESNLDGYESVVNDYYKSFPTYKQSQPKDNIIMAVLWNNINEKELVGSFNAILELRHFTFSNTIKGHLRVKAKSEQVLQLLDNLLEKE